MSGKPTSYYVVRVRADAPRAQVCRWLMEAALQLAMGLIQEPGQRVEVFDSEVVGWGRIEKEDSDAVQRTETS